MFTNIHTQKTTVLCAHKKLIVVVLFSDINSESLQADRLFRKTSAAMVQETEEPGQTEFAQKVSRGQVNTHVHTHTYTHKLLNTHAHTAIELLYRAGCSSCHPRVPLAI